MNRAVYDPCYFCIFLNLQVYWRLKACVFSTQNGKRNWMISNYWQGETLANNVLNTPRIY